jgi:hypothetical protein
MRYLDIGLNGMMMIIIIIIIIIIIGIETTENWYSHIPEAVCQHEDITVLWNQGIQTDREVLANRPDMIIKNKKDKICLLINVAIPSNRNVIQKEPENKLKYKNLSIEIQRMWNMNCFVILVIIGATGIVTRGLNKELCVELTQPTFLLHRFLILKLSCQWFSLGRSSL